MGTLESNSRGIGGVRNGGFFIQMSIIINLEHNILLSQGNQDDMQHHSWKLAGHPEKDVPCLRKQNHQTSLPMLVHEACVGVCMEGWPWAPADPSSFPWPFPSPHPPHCCEATSGACSCTPTHAILCLFCIA